MKVAMCLLAALQICAMLTVRDLPNKGGTAAPLAVAAQQHDREIVAKLSTPSRTDGPCFATDRYNVGDRGPHAFHTPNPELVEAYASGHLHRSTDVSLERFLSWRVRSLRDVARANPADADQALRDYVKTRKLALELTHRFYGEEGLNAVQAAYESPLDWFVLTSLRERRQAGAIGAGKDAALGREIDLLTSKPGEFIPCVAR